MLRKGEVKCRLPPHWWESWLEALCFCVVHPSFRQPHSHVCDVSRTLVGSFRFATSAWTQERWPHRAHDLFHTMIVTKVMTFHIQKVKGQLHCDVMIFCWTCSGHYCYSSGTVSWLVCGGTVAILVVLKRPYQTCIRSFCVGGIFNMRIIILNFSFKAAVSIVIILATLLSVVQSATLSLL